MGFVLSRVACQHQVSPRRWAVHPGAVRKMVTVTHSHELARVHRTCANYSTALTLIEAWLESGMYPGV